MWSFRYDMFCRNYIFQVLELGFVVLVLEFYLLYQSLSIGMFFGGYNGGSIEWYLIIRWER